MFSMEQFKCNSFLWPTKKAHSLLSALSLILRYPSSPGKHSSLKDSLTWISSIVVQGRLRLCPYAHASPRDIGSGVLSLLPSTVHVLYRASENRLSQSPLGGIVGIACLKLSDSLQPRMPAADSQEVHRAMFEGSATASIFLHTGSCG